MTRSLIVHRDRTADVLVLVAALTALTAVGASVVVLPAVVGSASARRHADPQSFTCPDLTPAAMLGGGVGRETSSPAPSGADTAAGPGRTP